MSESEILLTSHKKKLICYYFEVWAGLLESGSLVVLVWAHQDTHAAHRDSVLQTEELQLITVLSALQRRGIPGHLHYRVLPESRPLLVQQGVSLAQRGVTGETGPHGDRWRLDAVVTVDGGRWFGCPAYSCGWSISEVLYFGLKVGVYLQSEVGWKEDLTLRTEEGDALGRVRVPHSLDAGQTEVMSAGERHRFCE